MAWWVGLRGQIIELGGNTLSKDEAEPLGKPCTCMTVLVLVVQTGTFCTQQCSSQHSALPQLQTTEVQDGHCQWQQKLYHPQGSSVWYPSSIPCQPLNQLLVKYLHFSISDFSHSKRDVISCCSCSTCNYSDGANIIKAWLFYPKRFPLHCFWQPLVYPATCPTRLH